MMFGASQMIVRLTNSWKGGRGLSGMFAQLSKRRLSRLKTYSSCGAHVNVRSVGLWEAPSKLTGLLVAERIDRQVTAMAKIAFGEVILTL
jgi:hypothetical protein